jgi:AAA15 family ATPase/GTPase
MIFSKIEITGFRGFDQRGELEFAVPNGKSGSGLTIVVGANNSGKSTIFEAIRAVSQHQSPTILEERRNKNANELVNIVLSDSESKTITLSTVKSGGSETDFSVNLGVDTVNLMQNMDNSKQYAENE